jgi:hypothetical protein
MCEHDCFHVGQYIFNRTMVPKSPFIIVPATAGNTMGVES